MSLKLQSASWNRVTLRDVVRHVTDRVDAETSGLSRFLAGEHIPSANLTITSWGVIGKDPMGPMFYKRFRPEHVLYVSRRTYLRKVAVPDFEGITGEKTFVLETLDSNTLLQEFLPFVLSAERFHRYAIRNSRGSVNPYLNWGELASYEFALPSVGEQKRIADLLWSVERYGNQLEHLGDATRRAIARTLEKVTDEAEQLVSMADVAVVNPEQASGWLADRAIQYIDISSVKPNAQGIDLAAVKSMVFGEAPGRARRVVRAGDLLVSTVRPALRSVARVPAKFDGQLASTGFAVLRARPDVSSDLLWQVIRSDAFTSDMISKCTGSAYPAVRANDVATFEFGMPPPSVTHALDEKISRSEHASRAVASELKTLVAFRASILFEIFGES